MIKDIITYELFVSVNDVEKFERYMSLTDMEYKENIKFSIPVIYEIKYDRNDEKHVKHIEYLEKIFVSNSLNIL